MKSRMRRRTPFQGITSLFTLATIMFNLSLCVEVSLGEDEVGSLESSELRREANEAPNGSFEKRQGLLLVDEGEYGDQLAVESSRDQMAVESNGRPIPVPVPVGSQPGAVVIPIPAGIQQQQQRGNFIQQQQHSQQGQFSQHRPNVVQGHHNPQQQNTLHQQQAFRQQHQHLLQHIQQQQQQQHAHQQQQQHVHQQQQQHPHQQQQQHVHQQQHLQQFHRPAASGEFVIQKAKDVENGRQNLLPAHPTQQLVPPPQKFTGNQNFKNNNILRDLFKKNPGQSQRLNPFGVQPSKSPAPGPPNGGYFQGSHPKVMNRPNVPSKPHVLATNDLNAEGGALAPQYGVPAGPPGAPPHGGGSGAGNGIWPNGPDADMPKITTLEVKCEKNLMRVFVAFDKPFFGVIFSKGHYHNVHCIHLPAGLGHTSANFDIGIDSCGMQGNSENGLYGYGVESGSGSFFENTVVVQYDPQVQEVWDQARKLRCTWHDQYEKSVTFRPFSVDMLDVVRADFAGDNVGCWMQIQVGKGPWASEVSGLVKIGQTMTMVLAIKDDDNKFDMLVRNCVAHDGNRQPIQLVDQWGCITRPKLMSRFTKIKNFGPSATVLSYAHFQAFKFPDSMEVHFQCTIQICRHQCPDQCTQGGGAAPYGVGKSGLPAASGEHLEASRRKRRAVTISNETSATSGPNEDIVFEYQTTFKIDPNEDVGLNKVITVVSPEDLEFAKSTSETEEQVPVIESSIGDIICMSTFGFASMLTVLIGMLLFACVVSAVFIIKKPLTSGPRRTKRIMY